MLVSATLSDEIREELEALKPEDFFEPDTEVGERDHVVGELDEDMKRLLSLVHQYGKTLSESHIALDCLKDQEDIEHAEGRIAKLRERYEFLKERFWISTMISSDLMGMPHIGIRKGWKVVWTEPEHEETLFVFIEIHHELPALFL